MHAQQSTGATRLIFGQTLRLLPYFMCANSEGSGETARIALRLCDKYHNLMSCLIFSAYYGTAAVGRYKATSIFVILALLSSQVGHPFCDPYDAN